MRCSPATVATRRPVTTEPVKLTLPTAGCRTSASPTAGPSPVTTLSTPSGSPAAVAIRASESVVVEVNSEGFTTTALPAPSAGAMPRIPE